MSFGGEYPWSPLRAIPVKLKAKAAEAGYSYYPVAEISPSMRKQPVLGLASYRARVKLWFLLDWALNFS